MRRADGFTLVELITVVAILVVMCVIAIPNFQKVNANYKLNAAGHSVASVVQLARLQAVKANQPAYVQYSAGDPSIVFVNDDASTTFVSGNPDVAISNVSFQTTVPNDGQLKEYLGITGTATDPNLQVNTRIGFNARGLPCTMVTSSADCQQQQAGRVFVFEWLMTNGNGGWEAVTVTAAGRIKSWRLNSQSAANGPCGYPACWQ